MRRTAQQPLRGFTLIEVLVGLAIFAFAAVALSVAYINVISGFRSQSGRHEAEEDWKWVRAVVLAEPEREKVEEGGRLALADGQQVVWRAKIEQAPVADLFVLTLEAEAAGSASQEAWKRTESIHLLRPAWSDPAERDKLREQTRQRVERETRT